jgi:hypothetical protein
MVLVAIYVDINPIAWMQCEGGRRGRNLAPPVADEAKWKARERQSAAARQSRTVGIGKPWSLITMSEILLLHDT